MTTSSTSTPREKPREKPKGNVELPPNDHRRIGIDQQLFFFDPMR